MADKGRTFAAPMVRAILDGRKTQTRRLLKQPPEHITSAGVYSNSIEGMTDRWTWMGGDPRDMDTWEVGDDFKTGYCPGDRIYVREHWSSHPAFDGLAPRDLKRGSMIYTRADGVWHNAGDWLDAPFGKHRQGMHMPRWASRLLLTVTDVRVQRLQEIKREDAIAEGLVRLDTPDEWWDIGPLETPCVSRDPVRCYHNLWNSLHTEPGTRWEDSPWVVAVSFDVRRGNIDQGAK